MMSVVGGVGGGSRSSGRVGCLLVAIDRVKVVAGRGTAGCQECE